MNMLLQWLPISVLIFGFVNSNVIHHNVLKENLTMAVDITKLDHHFLMRESVSLNNFMNMLANTTSEMKAAVEMSSKENISIPFDALHGSPNSLSSQMAMEVASFNDDAHLVNLENIISYRLLNHIMHALFPMSLKPNGTVPLLMMKSGFIAIRNMAMMANVAWNLASLDMKVDVKAHINQQPTEIKKLMENICTLRDRCFYYIDKVKERTEEQYKDGVQAVREIFGDSSSIILIASVNDNINVENKQILLEAMNVLLNRLASNYEVNWQHEGNKDKYTQH